MTMLRSLIDFSVKMVFVLALEASVLSDFLFW